MSQNRNCKNKVVRHDKYFDFEQSLDDYLHHACSSWVWVNIDFHIKKEFGHTFEPWLGITVAYMHTCLQKSVRHLDPKRSASERRWRHLSDGACLFSGKPQLTLVAPIWRGKQNADRQLHLRPINHRCLGTRPNQAWEQILGIYHRVLLLGDN